MRILIVAATGMEIAPTIATMAGAAAHEPRLTAYKHAGHDVDVLITGVGMVATAAWCSRVLTTARYEIALNVGLCGSFDPAIAPGAVVHVVADRIAELGAEDGDAFLPLNELKLESEYELRNQLPPSIAALNCLPRVNGITVNTVHGNERSIAEVTARWRPQVESMEGAAFMYACAIQPVPYAQVRAVSNVVERRNRSAWKIGEAIANLNEVVMRIVEQA